MTNDYDAQIDAAFAPKSTPSTTEAVDKPVADTAPKVENDAPANDVENELDENGEPRASDDDSVRFPKKAINAISRRDKQIGKLRAEYQAAQAELAKLRQVEQAKTQSQGNAANDDGPKETDFQTYGEYLKAVARHEARKEWDSENRKASESQQSVQRQQWVAQREAAVAQQADAFLKATPDAREIITEYSDVIDSFPPQIEQLFLEAENAPLAVYTLAKEGKLEDLASMSVSRAAMEIGRAQSQAIAAPRNKISNAPEPLSSAKGTGSSAKSLDRMDYGQLRDWINS